METILKMSLNDIYANRCVLSALLCQLPLFQIMSIRWLAIPLVSPLLGSLNCHECHSRNKWIFLSPRSLKVRDCWGTQCDAGFHQCHGSSSPAARWAHRGQAAALGREVWGRGRCGGQCHVPEPRGCVILLLNRGPESKTSSSRILLNGVQHAP